MASQAPHLSFGQRSNMCKRPINKDETRREYLQFLQNDPLKMEQGEYEFLSLLSTVRVGNKSTCMQKTAGTTFAFSNMRG